MGLCVMVACLALGSCGKTSEKEQVSLRVWGSEEEQECLTQMVADFEEYYGDEAEFDIHIGVQNAGEFKNNYLKDVEDSADVFEYVDDQLYDLVAAESLLPITWEKQETIEENGGNGTAIQSASCDDVLYGYPMTASNGYFLYYNKKYLNEEDVQCFDRILEVASEHEKKMYMDWTSGWYVYSFFGGAGFEIRLADNRLTNICNWNEEVNGVKGTDVAESMLAIASYDSFLSGDNEVFLEGLKRGEVIAGVSGMWNEEAVSAAYGKDYAAVKLPTYTLNDEQIQMKSFCGYRLVGVNATTEEPEWSQKLARWITNEKNQALCFENTGKSPTNIVVAKSDKVKSAPAIQALHEQRQFSIVQNVGENFWGAASSFGMVMSSGNKDDLDLQVLLDEMVSEAERPIEKKEK